KKTALRLVLHLIRQDEAEVSHFSEVVAKMRSGIRFCRRCHNISDTELCNICSNTLRRQEMICVVENIRDVIAIESTQQFNGIYHVLGGIISPLDGIGPQDLAIDALIERVGKEETSEIIFALSPTIQGDTTIYYISKKLAALQPALPRSLKITTIARGISFGGELEYADEMTLAKSISNRIPVENFIHSGN
ncbi:MAG TPA: recombination mediator RecR, partial [Ferruginibacter sp.]|nr:recombination mediator RecR [Ferruginibacter sp.]